MSGLPGSPEDGVEMGTKQVYIPLRRSQQVSEMLSQNLMVTPLLLSLPSLNLVSPHPPPC